MFKNNLILKLILVLFISLCLINNQVSANGDSCFVGCLMKKNFIAHCTPKNIKSGNCQKILSDCRKYCENQSNSSSESEN